MTYVIIILLIAAVLFVIVKFLGRENVLAMLIGPPDQGRTDFKSLKRSSLPNNALICPENFCDIAIPEILAPKYKLSAIELRDHMRNFLKSEKRLERVHTNDPAMRERYVQRSELFRFADTIQVEYIPLTSNTSTIALYSHVQIGLGDHQVNRKRLKRWLKRLSEYELKDKIQS